MLTYLEITGRVLSIVSVITFIVAIILYCTIFRHLHIFLFPFGINVLAKMCEILEN